MLNESEQSIATYLCDYHQMAAHVFIIMTVILYVDIFVLLATGTKPNMYSGVCKTFGRDKYHKENPK